MGRLDTILIGTDQIFAGMRYCRTKKVTLLRTMQFFIDQSAMTLTLLQ